MKKSGRRLLAMVLVLVMCLSGTLSAFADTPKASSGKNSRSISISDLDPSTLNVKKLGEKKGNSGAVIDNSSENDYKPDDTVRVSIVLDKQSTMDAGYSTQGYTTNKNAIAYRNSLRQQQAAVTKQINSKLGKTLDVKWNLTFAVNIISANILYKEINMIKLIPGVKDVFIENRYDALKGEDSPNTSNTSEYMVGAAAAWSNGYTGAGSRIAIIDTGLDITHQSFDAEAFEYSLKKLGKDVDIMEEEDIPDAEELNGAGIYVSSKVPYAYNYVDGNAVNLGHNIDGKGNHGSHVAGIAAANRYVKDGDEFVDAASSVYAVGMAPDAQILVMKVFGQGGGAYDSDYMAAIEDALVMECDSVNLSLGSGAQGWTFAGQYQDVMNSLSNNECGTKTVVTISAGNGGAITDQGQTGLLYSGDVSMHTGGSPGTFVNSLGVASAENTGVTGNALIFNGDQVVFYSDTSKAGMPSVAGSYSYVYIDSIGEAEEYAAVNEVEPLSGKIIIVNRGEINFSTKGNNAIEYTPAAVVIANNQPGSLNMNLDAFTGDFPMVLIGYYDALAIKKASQAKTAGDYTYYTGTIEVGADILSGQTTDNAEMSSFSSWGVPGSLIMKPEITAPGGGIYSVNGTSNASDETTSGPTSYVNYSGTSMAAPHMAGLAAVLAQYLNENDIAEKNADLAENYSKRAIMQSLLMSTAVPMHEGSADGDYYSILQQGSGLADVDKAINARSVIMVGSEDDTLTAYTGAAADGKVKVEFGDNLFADEEGNRSYSFTIYNTSDKELEYELNTDTFTQYLAYDGYDFYMNKSTMGLGWDVVYDYDKPEEEDHDVNKDGATDEEDVQAILDYLTGIAAAEEISVEAGDLDGDGALSSYDAQLLIQYFEEQARGPVIPAGESMTVHVTVITNWDDVEYLNNYFPNGFYLEGFTYVSTKYEEEDGAEIEEEHSIPLLGFIGNWTDPSMFDTDSYTDVLYETYKYPYNYTQNYKTNYLTLTYNGVTQPFFGNPYYVEEGGFPYERLAINSKSTIKEIYYNLIRSAATTGFAVTQFTEEGATVLDARIDKNLVTGIWYNQNNGTWQNMGTKVYTVNKTPASYGLAEGDVFRIGYYALPEYYGFLVNDVISDGYAGAITYPQILAQLIQYDLIGQGSYIGYDFVIDDTLPVIDKTATVLDGTTLSIKASDETNLAYVAVTSLDGETVYAETAPGTPDAEVSFDIADAIEGEKGYVAVFVADYAGNEAAVAIQINDETEGIDPFHVDTLEIDPTALDLYKGDTADIIPTIQPITAEDRVIIWTSSDENVATVDENGTVTAIGAGKAVITATAHDNERITATCDVKVTSVDKDFTAIVWDEDGGDFFSTFNASSLPTWKRLHSEALGLQMMFTVKAKEALYAGSLDTSTGTTDLYTVDKSTYEATELAENYLFALDMAPTAFSNDFFVYAYGPYLMLGNLQPDEDYGYSGIPYAYLDPTAVLGNDIYIAGLAAKSLGAEESVYYFLDENGKIWQTSVTTSFRGASIQFEFSDPELVLDTGIPTDFLYQNLYCDGQYIYWSHYADNTSELLIIDPETGVIYHAGDFGDGVWPVSGIFEDDPEAAADDSSSIDVANVERIADAEIERFKDEKINARIIEHYEAAAAKSHVVAPAPNPVNKNVGGTNAIKTGVSEIKKAAVEEDDNICYVTITEEDEVYNGLYRVKFDPEEFEFVEDESECGADFCSANIEDGVLTIAFASAEAIEAGDIIASLAFKGLSCEGGKLSVTTNEKNEELALDVYEEISIESTHEWGEPSYEWAEDNSTVTASRVCSRDPEHVETETVTTTTTEVRPTAYKEGSLTYTAEFENKGFETQTRVEVIPKLDIEPGWKEDSKGEWYLNEDGTYTSNDWQEIDGEWYYFNKWGYKQTGWIKVDGTWYYLDEDGVRQSGWVKVDGQWYFFEEDGKMHTGWLEENGDKYYFKASGAMATAWCKVDGEYYYFGKYGIMQTGWVKDGEDWYYLAADGKMQTGWLEQGSKKYYLNTSGKMQTEWGKIDGSWYYFGSSGVMQTGWLNDNGNWYYLDTDGKMLISWQTIDGNKYYFKPSGIMANSEWYAGWWFNANGTWTYKYTGSWKEDSRGWKFSDTSGWYPKNETVRIDNKLYTFDADGYWIQ